MGRLEVVVPESDRDRLKELARLLREGGSRASRLRSAVDLAVKDKRPPNFKEYLESAPLEGVDLTRDQDLGRDIEL